MRLTFLGCYGKLINVTFLECWAVWTVCTGCGKTVQQHITECILVMSTDRLLCSKPSPPTTCGYDMFFFACPGLTMILMYSTPPICLLTYEKDVALSANYTIMGNCYNMRYYLADDIYPKRTTIVQSISHPQELTHELFAKKHESYRNDVKRAFWVLQARFAIIRRPTRLWRHEDLTIIMKACIILHNMIIEDERVNDIELVAIAYGNDDYDSLGTDGPVEVSRGPRPFD